MEKGKTEAKKNGKQPIRYVTKREKIATAAMQGLLSRNLQAQRSEEVAFEAVRYADALLLALELQD